MRAKSFPLSKVYTLLEPGPVVLLATSYKGRSNVMTMSWTMMVDFDPPLVACVVSDQNYTFSLLKKSKQCVIAIPTVEMLDTVVQIGNCSGRDINKFQAFSLLQEKGACVQSPILPECYANLECEVIDVKMASKYNIFILKVLKASVRRIKKRALMIHHCGKGNFVIDGKIQKINSVKK